MSDVVPPGGDRPLDDEPWLARPDPIAPIAPIAAVELPEVPQASPGAVAPPGDWRSLADASGFVPPGYQRPAGPPVHVVLRRDSLGLAGCVAGAAGLLQLLLVSVPLIAVLAIALSLSGRRSARLDPHGVGTGRLATIGLALGAIGAVTGIGLLLADAPFVLLG